MDAASNIHQKMTRHLTKLLAVAAACSFVGPACGLTIVPTFDRSITGNANVVAITNGIYYAIRVMQSNITDNVTVRIKFVEDENVGLGQSDTFGNDYIYSSFISALRSHAKSVTDTNALSKLPNSSTDPVVGGTQIYLTLAQARLLGLDSGYGTGNLDSTISCKMSEMNFTRPSTNSDNYDLPSVLEHEMDEVLGTASDLAFSASEISPADLFRYTTNLASSYTTTDDSNAYFSPDGTNLLARYNTDGYGDYGDWWSYSAHWSPVTGITNYFPQVQDAYGTPGSYEDIGVSERTLLDVVGWTLSAAPVTKPPLKIVRSGANQFTFSWTNTATGYVLQERTNLLLGSWNFSVTGGTNPAVIVTTNAQKFYRLYKSSSSELPAPANVVVPAAQGSYRLVTHILRPRPQ
jgi:hypothetical protein